MEPGTNIKNPRMVGIIGYRYLGGYHWLYLVASSLAGECGRRQGVIELWEVRVINWALTALPDQKKSALSLKPRGFLLFHYLVFYIAAAVPKKNKTK